MSQSDRNTQGQFPIPLKAGESSPFYASRRRTRVSVNPALIRWAVERFGDRAALARQFPKLERWLEGTEQPTLRQLEEFAHAALVPFGYLFLAEPPQDDIELPDFRIRRGTKPKLTAAMRALVGMLQVRQDWLSEYRQREGWDPLPFVRKYEPTTDAAVVARDMHAVLNLEDDWTLRSPSVAAALTTLLEQAEAAGIAVVFNSILGNNTHHRLAEDFSGFVLIDRYAPFIFINTARERSKAAQIFTLAHELAHVWIGESGISRVTLEYQLDETTERACNRIAGAFLMPPSLFRATWEDVRQRHQREAITLLARQWKVSRAAIIVRALELRLLDREIGSELLEELQLKTEELEKQTPSAGGDFYRMQLLRLGRPLVEATFEALETRSLTVSEAAELLGLNVTTLRNLLERVAGGSQSYAPLRD